MNEAALRPRFHIYAAVQQEQEAIRSLEKQLLTAVGAGNVPLLELLLSIEVRPLLWLPMQSNTLCRILYC